MELLYDIQLDNGIKYKAKGEDTLPLKCGDYCIIRKDFFLDYGQVISSGVPRVCPRITAAPDFAATAAIAGS